MYDILLVYQIFFASVLPLVSYMNMSLLIVHCCGTKRVLFTKFSLKRVSDAQRLTDSCVRFHECAWAIHKD